MIIIGKRDLVCYRYIIDIFIIENFQRKILPFVTDGTWRMTKEVLVKQNPENYAWFSKIANFIRI